MNISIFITVIIFYFDSYKNGLLTIYLSPTNVKIKKNKTILFIFISKLYNDNDKYCVKNECVYNNVK